MMAALFSQTPVAVGFSAKFFGTVTGERFQAVGF
jgi:hypothetical protein